MFQPSNMENTLKYVNQGPTNAKSAKRTLLIKIMLCILLHAEESKDLYKHIIMKLKTV